MAIEKTLGAMSIYGTKIKQGLVELRIGDKAVQITPQEAKDFAYFILEEVEIIEFRKFINKKRIEK